MTRNKNKPKTSSQKTPVLLQSAKSTPVQGNHRNKDKGKNTAQATSSQPTPVPPIPMQATSLQPSRSKPSPPQPSRSKPSPPQSSPPQPSPPQSSPPQSSPPQPSPPQSSPPQPSPPQPSSPQPSSPQPSPAKVQLDTQAQLAAFLRQLEKLTSDVNASAVNTHALTELTERVLSLEGEVSFLGGENVTLTRRVSVLGEENTTLTRRVLVLGEENATLTKRVSTVEGQNARLTKDVVTLQSMVNLLVPVCKSTQEGLRLLLQDAKEIFEETTFLSEHGTIDVLESRYRENAGDEDSDVVKLCREARGGDKDLRLAAQGTLKKFLKSPASLLIVEALRSLEYKDTPEDLSMREKRNNLSHFTISRKFARMYIDGLKWKNAIKKAAKELIDSTDVYILGSQERLYFADSKDDTTGYEKQEKMVGKIDKLLEEIGRSQTTFAALNFSLKGISYSAALSGKKTEPSNPKPPLGST